MEKIGRWIEAVRGELLIICNTYCSLLGARH